MEYTKQEQTLIYEMKKIIINEFRYANKEPEREMLFIWGLPDITQDIEDLQDAFRMGMSDNERKIIRKYDFDDLFSQALVELFDEELIEFIDKDTVGMTEKGEEKFIIPDRLYKSPLAGLA
jgi:hypothetical protein